MVLVGYVEYVFEVFLWLGLVGYEDIGENYKSL
jgi:hypothetical protein